MKSIIDRLKILEYRLSKYTLATSLKKELRAIIEELEEIKK